MRLTRRLASLVVFTAAASAFTQAETGSETTDPAVRLLQTELATLVSGSGGPGAERGVFAVAIAAGDTLFALNEDVALAPASNMKLFTSAAALHYLGPDYRFSTFLLTDGNVRDGVLEGNLILYGTGDPSISDRLLPSLTGAFEEMAVALREAGIHRIEGEVLGDGTFFEGPPRRHSWPLGSLNDWYAAPVSSLSFNDNVITLRMSAGAPGRPPLVATTPEGMRLPIANRGVTVAGARGSSLLLVRVAPDDAIQLSGRIGLGQREVWRRLTVPDPAEYAASILRYVLEAEGIQVEGAARSIRERTDSSVTGRQLVAPAFDRSGGTSATRLRTLAVHRSPPVSELVKIVNMESHNLYAELLLFAIGKVVTGEGSFAAGSRVLTDFLVRQVGLSPESLHVEDGSGLSPLNRASAAGLVRLLAYALESEHADVFLASLPEAGNFRELGRMYRSPAAGNLRAKTGTIRRVSALSGVVTSRDGELILFSILANNVPSSGAAKRVEDQVGIRLASFRRSAGWVAASREPDSPAGVSSEPVLDYR